MTKDIAEELRETVDRAVEKLARLDEAVVNAKPNANVWFTSVTT